LIIESESTDGTKEYLEQLMKEKTNVKVIWGKKEGLPKAMNLGIQNCTGDVVITQNDVNFLKYSTDWLKEIQEMVENVPEIGVIAAENSYFNRKWDDFPWVGTWFMYIPRRTIDKIGLFDENFGPGCGEDLDYSLRLLKENLRIGVKKGFYVVHRRDDVEHYNDWEELKEKNIKYLKEKHNWYMLWERYEMMEGGKLDVAGYLRYFYYLILEREPKVILELGTRNGVSTSAFVEAAKRVNAMVISVDINPCPVAVAGIKAINGLGNWIFIHADDRTLSWETDIDVLFIDTDHSYALTMFELQKYIPHVKKDGIVLMHDTKSWPEVKKAIDDYLLQNTNLTYEEYPSDFFTGLGILKWKSS